MKKALLFLFLLSTALHGQIIVSPEEYTFPKVRPLIAAISTSFVGAPNGSWLHVKLTVKDRKIKGVDERVHFRYFWPGPKMDNRELVYILTGFGSSVKSAKANYLARRLAEEGFHSIVLPSIFSERFIIGASSNGVVGEFQQDAYDYLQLMKKAHGYIRDLYGITFLKKHMIGYSYGGLTAAFVARIDQNRFFKLSQEVLINPPTNLLKAAKIVDGFTSRRNQIGEWQFLKALAKAGYLSFRFKKYEPILPIYKRYVKKLNFSEHQSMAMVGHSLTSELPDVAKSAQKVLIHEHGNLAGTFKLSNKAINNINLDEYIEKIVLPYQKTNNDPRDTREKLGKRNSLYALDSYFRNNDNVYLIHTKDDFLINTKDIKYFSQAFKDRFVLFPWGGHLGNFWHSQNMGVLTAILKGKALRSAIREKDF